MSGVELDEGSTLWVLISKPGQAMQLKRIISVLGAAAVLLTGCADFANMTPGEKLAVAQMIQHSGDSIQAGFSQMSQVPQYQPIPSAIPATVPVLPPTILQPYHPNL
jgi:hypothetical protein